LVLQHLEAQNIVPAHLTARIDEFEGCTVKRTSCPGDRFLWRRCLLTAGALLVAAQSSGCHRIVHLAAVPDAYQPTRDELSLARSLGIRSPTRGAAYAFGRVRDGVAHADDGQAKDFVVTFEGMAYQRRFDESLGGIAMRTEWKRVTIRWSAMTQCSIRSGLSGRTAEFRGVTEICGATGCTFRDSLLDIPLEGSRALSDFVAGARVLAGIDPDPDPRPVVDRSPTVAP
jgi:hypothetical protein